MRVKYLLIPCLLVLCTFVYAVGNDRVKVNMPHPVTVGDKVLQPGEYEIRQLDSNGGARHVVQVFSDDGMQFETTVMTIPTLDNRTPEDSKVVLHRIGDEYYFDKLWVQGKNYGYEFPLPEAVKSRERERRESVNVAAVMQPAETSRTESTTTETTTRESTRESTEIAQAQPQQPPAQDRPAQERAAEAQTPQREPEVQTPQRETPARDVPAQQDPAAQTPATPAAPDASHEAQAQPATPAQPDEMPQTAANWLTLLLGGGALSALGLKLRRR